MFSGIVEEVGSVLARQHDPSSATLRIAAQKVLEGTRVGDSLAINGICLTVTRLTVGAFTVDVSPETWRRTNLSSLTTGSQVNLERSLAVGGRIGGHFVQGHVDGVGQVRALQREGNAVVARFSAPSEIIRYLVDRGFVAVDGASLTIVARFPDSFAVSLIPHTRASSIADSYHVGDRVNVEVDILGKYVEQFLSAQRSEGTPGGSVTRELLERNGFID